MFKVVEAVIDTRIKTVVNFHDVFHRFCAGRGMGTTVLELKTTQGLASVYQEPLLLVLLDLIKAYANLDRGWLLQKMSGYGVGPKIKGLLAELWLRQEVIT